MTYRETAPHEYILERDYADKFHIIAERIDKEGVKELFTMFGQETWYTYLYCGGYRYWRIEDVLNRCPARAMRTNINPSNPISNSRE